MEQEEADHKSGVMTRLSERLQAARVESDARAEQWTAGEGAPWLYALIDRVLDDLPAPKTAKDREFAEYYLHEYVKWDLHPVEPSVEGLDNLAAKLRKDVLSMRLFRKNGLGSLALGIGRQSSVVDMFRTPQMSVREMLRPSALNAILKPGGVAGAMFTSPADSLNKMAKVASIGVTPNVLQRSVAASTLALDTSSIHDTFGPGSIHATFRGTRSLLDSIGATPSVLNSVNGALGTNFASYDEIDETPVSALPALRSATEIEPVKLPALATRDDAQRQVSAVEELAVMFQAQAEAAELRHRQQMEASTQQYELQRGETKRADRRALVASVAGATATFASLVLALVIALL